MLWTTVLGWATVAAIAITTGGTMRYLWIAAQRPWKLIPKPPVPAAIEVGLAEPDEYIPWI